MYTQGGLFCFVLVLCIDVNLVVRGSGNWLSSICGEVGPVHVGGGRGCCERVGGINT